MIRLGLFFLTIPATFVGTLAYRAVVPDHCDPALIKAFVVTLYTASAIVSWESTLWCLRKIGLVTA